MHGHKPELQSFGHPGTPCWSHFSLRDLLSVAPSGQGCLMGMEPPDFGCSAGPCGSSRSPRKPREPWTLLTSTALAPLCLRPICPLQAAAFSFQASPVLRGARIYIPPPPRAQHRQAGSAPSPRRASVSPGPREEQQSPAGPGVSVLPQRSRQGCPFNRRAIPLSPQGDTAELGRHRTGGSSAGRGHHITAQRAQNDPNGRDFIPARTLGKGFSLDWEREGKNGGEPPQECSEL